MKVRQLSDSKGLSYLHLVMLSLYAILLGVLVGLIDAVFGRVLIGLSEFRDHHLFYLVPALPLAGLLIVYLYQKFAGKAAQGMGLIFKVGHNEEDQVPLRLIPLVTVTTWLTHLFGGSAGREGVSLTIDLETFMKLALLGLAFGLAGNLFAYLLSLAKKKVASLLPNPYYRVLLGGVVLTCLLLILCKGRYTGLGTNLIALSVDGGTIYPLDWLFKLLLTVFTLSLGFQGGEVTPLFAIGASLGAVLAPILGLPISLVAGLGYLSVFGSSTNTLLAPIFIGIEGDTVRVHAKVVEGTRERIQIFEGVVISRKGQGISEMYTVRKISSGIGVERTFPIHTPRVDKIEVVRYGKVRRAKLYYLRALQGKAARIKEIRK